MGSPQDDYDLLLTAVDPTTADLARGLLAEAGIPCLSHGPDFDVAELGLAGHAVVRFNDIFVPRGSHAAARAALAAAWGDDRVRQHEP